MRVLLVCLCLLWLAGCGQYQSSEVLDALPGSSEIHSSIPSIENIQNAYTDDERDLSYTAEYRLKTEHPDEVHVSLINLVECYDGFVLEAGTSRLVFRLRSEFLSDAILEIEAMGEVLSKEVIGKDVTDARFDLKLRLDNAFKKLAKYQQMSEREQSVESVKYLQQKIEETIKQIEQLEGRLYKLEHVIQYTTFTVETSPEAKPGPLGWVISNTLKGVKKLFIW